MNPKTKCRLRGLSPFLGLILVLNLTGNIPAFGADTERQRVNAIKVAFVVNIARFVTWPEGTFENDNDTLHLCIYRDNIYGEALKAASGNKINNRRIEVSYIKQFKSENDCEILLIPHTETDRFSAEINGKLTQPLLTIADYTTDGIKGVSRQGVIVTMVRKDTRIAFEIDPWQARRVNLQISSELLKLARIVGDDS